MLIIRRVKVFLSILFIIMFHIVILLHSSLYNNVIYDTKYVYIHSKNFAILCKNYSRCSNQSLMLIVLSFTIPKDVKYGSSEKETKERALDALRNKYMVLNAVVRTYLISKATLKRRFGGRKPQGRP